MEETRIEQLQDFLIKNGCDLAVIHLNENVVMFTNGYWPRNGLSFVVIPAEGMPSLVIPDPEKEDIAQLKAYDVYTYGTVLLSAGSEYTNLINAFKSIKRKYSLPDNAIIGYEKYASAVSPSLCDGEYHLINKETESAIIDGFQGVLAVDVEEFIQDIRSCKNEQEVEKIKKANKLGYEGLSLAQDILNKDEKVTEIQLASMIEGYIACSAEKYGVKYARAWAQITSGIRTVDAWKAGVVTSSKLITDGDFVMIELCVSADGYFADLTSTYYKGNLDNTKHEILQLVKKSQEAALNELGEGKKASNAFLAAKKVCDDAGYGESFLHE